MSKTSGAPGTRGRTDRRSSDGNSLPPPVFQPRSEIFDCHDTKQRQDPMVQGDITYLNATAPRRGPWDPALISPSGVLGGRRWRLGGAAVLSDWG